MTGYYAIVHKDDDSAYGVSFPDLPGCFSAADSLDDVVAQAREALALYLEDLDAAPPASRLEQVRAMAADDLADGAFVVLVPQVARTRTLSRINIPLDTGTLSAIDHAAKARNLTRSAFLAHAARREIEGR
jgi:predicted RNase H-like HicB family nuclease